MSVTNWEASHRQTAGGAVESEQRVVVGAPVVSFDDDGARELGERYWREVERATHGLVRLRRSGERLELRLLVHGPVLLSFEPPALEAAPDAVRCTFTIRGGLLTQRPEGELSFSQLNGDRLELRSAIRGFFPALAAREGEPHWTGALYNLVQSRLHVAISRRYFARLAGASRP